jgi:uncharacterized protein YcbK (DUF882 family)
MREDCLDVRRRRFLQVSAAFAAGITAPTAWTKPRAQAPRSLAFLNLHTGEEVSARYWRDGAYDPDAMHRIDHVLRDHRADETRAMDRALLDLLYRLKTSLGIDAPFQVISGYRSPSTNQALARSSSGVAKRSLHMQGKAIDIRIPKLATSDLYAAALALQGGGVGYYRKSAFIHLDTGRVRTWRG